MLNKKLLLLCCVGGLSAQVSTAKDLNSKQHVGSKAKVSTTSSATIPPKIRKALQKNIPCLIENVGQIKDQNGALRQDINFKLQSDFMNVFIGAGAIYYQWATPKGSEGPKNLETYRLDMQLLGANKNATATKAIPSNYKEQYLGDPDVSKDAYGYEKISYQNIYPNIDWVLYLKDGKLEYDFVVHLGGKVSDIKIKYNGATKMQKKADGSIAAYSPSGFVNEHAPISYSLAVNSNKKTAVKSSFMVKDNVTSFSVGKYQGTLVIDPVLDWATYYGGVSTEDGYGVAVDGSGNVYLTGYTLSLTNIATSGAFQTNFTPGQLSALDAYLVKFDSNGVRQWGTYYGSNGSDVSNTVACDPNGNVYIAGSSSSQIGIATAGSHQDALVGMSDAFIAKFSPSGARIWGTYYGGNSPVGVMNSDIISIIKCDDSGNVYIAGSTNSIDNIASVGAYQTTYSGVTDIFVAKFDSTGARQWGTYLGGTANDGARGLALDNNRNIYIAGSTQSTTGIASTGAAQAVIGATTSTDAYLMKLTNNGIYQWGTYFGGTDYDNGSGVSCDENGNVYMVGSAGANSVGLATTGSYQSIQKGVGDAFLVKYDSTGAKIWSTYYGGTNIDQGNAVMYDGFGNVYLLGNTKSTSFISTLGTYQDTIGMANAYDAFLVKFKNDGSRVWATYYGGKKDDYGKAISMNKMTGDIYFSGQTSSSQQGIATSGSHQDTAAALNGTDAILVKFRECPTIHTLTIGAISGSDSICPNSKVLYAVIPIPGVSSYTWTLPDGATGTSDSASILVTLGQTGGNIKVKASNACDTTAWQSLNIYIYPFFDVVITVDSLNLGTASSYATYQWILNGQVIQGATNSIYHVTQNGNYSVAVTSAQGCIDTSEVYVVTNVKPPLAIHDQNTIKAQIHIYPNPASDVINIQAPVKVNVILTTLEGRMLSNHKNVKSLSVKDLAMGVYLLRITDDAGNFIKAEKFIKK